MLAPDFNWQGVRKAVTYLPSDSLARIRTSSNSLAWLDVHLNQQDGQAYVRWYGSWTLAESLPGFEKFEAIPTKKLYDTSTGEQVDTGIPVGAESV